MQTHFRKPYTPARMWALACCMLLIATACQSGTVSQLSTQDTPSVPPGPGGAAILQLPEPSAFHTASAARTWYLEPGAVIAQGGQIDAEGVVRNDAATDYSYQIFSLGPYTTAAPPKVAAVAREVANVDYYYPDRPTLYIGLANFERNAWRWYPVENVEGVEAVILGAGSFIDPDTGQALLAAVWYGRGAVALAHTEGALLGSAGTVHDGDLYLPDNSALAQFDHASILCGRLTTEPEFTDYAGLAGLEAVIGEAWLAVPDQAALDLPDSLHYIGGRLDLHPGGSVAAFSATGLEYARGISFSKLTGLQAVDLTHLRTLGGTHNSYSAGALVFDSTPQLATVDLPVLAKADDYISYKNTSLTEPASATATLAFPALTDCRSFYMQGNSSFASVSMPLATALDDLSLGTSTVSSMNFNSLARVKRLAFKDYQGASLPGFPQLTAIEDGGMLELQHCPNLASLSSLSAMSSEGSLGLLNVTGCPQLTSLSGLEWIDGYAGSIWLEDNLQLTDLSALAGITAIGQPPAPASVKLGAIAPSDGPSDPGDPGNDSNDLMIKGNASLASLAALNLESVAHSITIDNNASLSSLAGFFSGSSMVELGIRNCPALQDLTGLESVHRVGRLSINGNNQLASLAGLDTLTECCGLSISSNPLLAGLDPLENLTNSGGDIALASVTIIDNASLQSLTGLANLQPNTSGLVVYYQVWIANNPALTGGDQAAWDLIDAWGGTGVIGEEIYIAGNGS
jgi:hypothetical protein